MTQEKVKTL